MVRSSVCATPVIVGCVGPAEDLAIMVVLPCIWTKRGGGGKGGLPPPAARAGARPTTPGGRKTLASCVFLLRAGRRGGGGESVDYQRRPLVRGDARHDRGGDLGGHV